MLNASKKIALQAIKSLYKPTINKSTSKTPHKSVMMNTIE